MPLPVYHYRMLTIETARRLMAERRSARDGGGRPVCANGNEIAAFSPANPEPLPEMQAVMGHHLDLTLAEAIARLEGRYAADAAAYDQIVHMAC